MLSERSQRGAGSRTVIRDQGSQDLGADSRVLIGGEGGGNDVITPVSCENQPGNWSEDGMDRERLEIGEPWTKEESKVA